MTMSKYIKLNKVLNELGLDHKDYVYIDKNEVAERIKKLPSIDIEPKRGEWIPCSERLPSGEDAVLVNTCAFDAIYDVVFMMAKDVERFYERGYVNAWMPSPEPYGERKESE